VFDVLAVTDDPVVPNDEELERTERGQLTVGGFALIEELQIDALFGADHSRRSA